jgi:hypothetical protein
MINNIEITKQDEKYYVTYQQTEGNETVTKEAEFESKMSLWHFLSSTILLRF